MLAHFQLCFVEPRKNRVRSAERAEGDSKDLRERVQSAAQGSSEA